MILCEFKPNPPSSTFPTIIGNDRVLLNETGHHTVQDTVTSNIYPMRQNNQQVYTPAGLVAIPIPFPGGVTFVFQPESCNCASNVGTSTYLQQVQEQPTQTSEQRMQCNYEAALKQLEQRIMENMLQNSQQQLRPYQLNFHFDAGTSTVDLNKSQQDNFKTTQTDLKLCKDQGIDCNFTFVCKCDDKYSNDEESGISEELENDYSYNNNFSESSDGLDSDYVEENRKKHPLKRLAKKWKKNKKKRKSEKIDD